MVVQNRVTPSQSPDNLDVIDLDFQLETWTLELDLYCDNINNVTEKQTEK